MGENTKGKGTEINALYCIWEHCHTMFFKNLSKDGTPKMILAKHLRDDTFGLW